MQEDKQPHLKACCRNPAAERRLWGGTTSSLPGAIQKMRLPSRWCTRLHLWVTGRPIMGSAYENKWVSRASACLSADSHSWRVCCFWTVSRSAWKKKPCSVLFLCLRLFCDGGRGGCERRRSHDTIRQGHLASAWCLPLHELKAVRTFDCDKATSVRRVAPAQCRFTGFTRHSE